MHLMLSKYDQEPPRHQDTSIYIGGLTAEESLELLNIMHLSSSRKLDRLHHALCKGIELHVFGVENKLSKQDQQLKGYAEAAARNEAIADEKAEKLKDFARGATEYSTLNEDTDEKFLRHEPKGEHLDDDPDKGVLSHDEYIKEATGQI